MTRIRIGVQLHPQHTSYADFADAVRRAEDLGVDTIWNWDHFFPVQGDPDGPHFESWTLLAAMAASTTRATLGCLVTCNTYRNPALLSNMAKTVDHIADGRLVLGLGAGWFERDYREFGYEFGTVASRLRALERAISIIKDRWVEDHPPPVRGTIPILIGGEGERVTLRIAAQYADAWNGFGGLENYRRKMQVLDDWCRKLGRDPAAIERTVSIDPSELTILGRLADIGCQHFILALDPPYDAKPVELLVGWRDRRNRG